MTDEPSDVDAAIPPQPAVPHPVQPQPPADPVADKAVRDAEFALFYRSEFVQLVGFLMVQGAGPLAADIAQESMTEAYRQWDLLDRPGGWVRIVAQRCWWARAERGRAEVPHDDLPEPSGLLPPGAYEQIENRHLLLTLLDDLSELQRQVLAWSYDGYQPIEIAVALQKPAATVRSALREARKKVRAAYPRDEETS